MFHVGAWSIRAKHRFRVNLPRVVNWTPLLKNDALI
jgi:hypothetical protein